MNLTHKQQRFLECVLTEFEYQLSEGHNRMNSTIPLKYSVEPRGWGILHLAHIVNTVITDGFYHENQSTILNIIGELYSNIKRGQIEFK